MKELNKRLAEIEHRLTHLEVGLKLTDERNFELEFVAGWLLAKHPGDVAVAFLSCHANDLEESEHGKTRHQEAILLLDDLRDFVKTWHAQWSSGRNPPG